MAIYSLNLGFISRSEGRSSVGFSAYISGSRSTDERSGHTYNYSKKEEVILSHILAPKGADTWATDPSALWNHVERFEDAIADSRFRGDSPDPQKQQKSLAAKEKFLASTQTAQTVMGALPLEFTHAQAKACVEEFLKTRFVSRGLIVHYALHWDSGNPHFHAMITRRPLKNGEFSQHKDHEIVSRPEHKITRKHWEIVANKYLALAGHEVRIDSRSHKDRGSLFLVSAHEGYHAQRLAEKGEYSRLVSHNEAVRQRNIEILCDSPEALIHEVSQKRTTFTTKHIEDEIIRRVGGDEHLFALLKARVDGIENPGEFAAHENFDAGIRRVAQKLANHLLQNPEFTPSVGENVGREEVFTSAAYKAQEEKLIKLADTIHQRTSKILTEEQIYSAVDSHGEELGFSLSDEQQEAVQYLCAGSDIRLLNGRAGTGKTTLLKAVAGAYQSAGYHVLGTSFQGKAVEIMEREIGISCKTLDCLKLSWERHDVQKALVESGRLWGKPYLYAFQKMKELEKSRFTERDVILVDEANMISGKLWEPFLKEVTTRGAKVLIIQDIAQIKSRDPGDTGCLFAQRFGTAETREVMRQKIDWQKSCSLLLNEGNVLDGLRPYFEKGHLKWHDTAFETRNSLVQAYLQDLIANPGQSRIALAYRNRDVEIL